MSEYMNIQIIQAEQEIKNANAIIGLGVLLGFFTLVGFLLVPLGIGKRNIAKETIDKLGRLANSNRPEPVKAGFMAKL